MIVDHSLRFYFRDKVAFRNLSKSPIQSIKSFLDSVSSGKWRFPEIGVPPNYPVLDGIFHEINHPAVWVPPLMETLNPLTTSPGTWPSIMWSVLVSRIRTGRPREKGENETALEKPVNASCIWLVFPIPWLLYTYTYTHLYIYA